MSKFMCIFRLICLLVGLSACSGLNKEVIENDLPILEDVGEDVMHLEWGQEIENTPPKKPLGPVPKRKRHKFGDHLILDRLMTTLDEFSIA